MDNGVYGLHTGNSRTVSSDNICHSWLAYYQQQAHRINSIVQLYARNIYNIKQVKLVLIKVLFYVTTVAVTARKVSK